MYRAAIQNRSEDGTNACAQMISWRKCCPRERSQRCNGSQCYICGQSDNPLNQGMSAAFLTNPSLAPLSLCPKRWLKVDKMGNQCSSKLLKSIASILLCRSNCKMGILQGHGSHTLPQDEGETPMMDLVKKGCSPGMPMQIRYEHGGLGMYTEIRCRFGDTNTGTQSR